MRYVVRLWAPVLLFVAAIVIPLLLGDLVAGRAGLLFVSSVIFFGLFVWVTAMLVADMKECDRAERESAHCTCPPGGPDDLRHDEGCPCRRGGS